MTALPSQKLTRRTLKIIDKFSKILHEIWIQDPKVLKIIDDLVE